MTNNLIKHYVTLASSSIALSSVLPAGLDVTGPLQLTVEVPHNATVTVMDDLHELGLVNTTLELLVGASAMLWYTLKATQGVERLMNQTLVPETDTTVLLRTINVRLMGQGAHATVRCLCFGFDKKVFKFKTLQDHQTSDATSSLVIKTVLDDQSQLICHNVIKVQKNAQRTNAEQENKNILLARGARAVSVPMLEIEADDVRCQHGAAVSRLDQEHLFYLQSRGLDAQQTRQMLIESFLS
ncbi:SufD family Fe-S cluster assembly protein [bacterium]|nr:MAG: SufD family Fe-S cluster assembly protein [bacterium]